MDQRLAKIGYHVRDVLLPYLPHLSILAVVAAIGLLVSLRTISLPIPATETQDRWKPPQWKPYRAGPLRDEVLDAQLWGDTPGAGQSKAEAHADVPPWRFVGTIQEGNKRVAVIEIEGQHIQRMAPGEALPDGTRIEAVAPNTMTVAENGGDRTVKLFDIAKPNYGTAKGK